MCALVMCVVNEGAGTSVIHSVVNQYHLNEKKNHFEKANQIGRENIKL